ncbi:DUF4194 domain-containing protein [Hymenobacter gummosus]|uniref:DUF4194 domain-containing protein n=1 Tax=Hymenobacter gummosus TaxID=1776032 RepID=A0A431TXB2_9BACT|nr:DUF4194 domain-containing protein [Hymenobacter gummosus]RTQ46030.1 DUF4194 domain-containing protein [Hymenobacter gummosus]
MLADFAPLVLRLLQGALYDTDKVQWRQLEQLQVSISQYLAKIGLELCLDPEQGLAYVRQPAPSDEEAHEDQTGLPRLMRRHQLSYELTMLCVVLRHHLDKFDHAATDDSRRCFITRAELEQGLEQFVRADEGKFRKQLDADVQKAVNLGFLRPVLADKAVNEEPRYEILRLVTALITNEKLRGIRDRLRQHLTPTPEAATEL